MKTISDVSLRYRPFRVKFHGPGNVRSSRVYIHDLRHLTKKILSKDSSFRDSDEQALVYLESIGIKITALGLDESATLLLTEDFQTELR